MRLGIAASDLMGVFLILKAPVCVLFWPSEDYESLYAHNLCISSLSIYYWCTSCMPFTVLYLSVLFQHDLFITLRHFLISFEHMFSIHPWFTSLFFFSLSLSLVSTSHHGLFHDALHGYYYWLSHVFIWPQRGSLCPIWTAFCPLPCPKSLWMSQCAWHLSQPGER